MKTIAVFCGGGIRGYTEAEYCKLINLKADMYAGTSIGGLIACAKANHREWKDITALFAMNGGMIFKKTFGYNFKLLYRNHRYSNEGLKLSLKDFFGDTRMNQLSPVCITAMNITKEFYGPHFFSELSKTKVVDVCMATSAAPTYFPPYKGYVDGGLFMNNPVLYAVLKAKTLWPKETFHVINIGSGEGVIETGAAINGLDIINDVINHCLNGSEMAAKEMMDRFNIVDIYEYHDFHYSSPIAMDDTDDESFSIMRKAAYEEYIRSSNKKF